MSKNGQRINWESVRGQLAQNQAALEQALAADAHRIEKAFERRTAQLANRSHAQSAAAPVPVQVFLLGEQFYGIELSELAEVLPFNKGTCTFVPEAPAEILGIINLRGGIRAVADLPLLLGVGNGPTQTSGYVLLVGKRGEEIGLRIDRLDQIRLFPPEALAGPNAGAGNVPARYLKAFTADRVILLSAGAIRSHPVFAAVRADGAPIIQ